MTYLKKFESDTRVGGCNCSFAEGLEGFVEGMCPETDDEVVFDRNVSQTGG